MMTFNRRNAVMFGAMVLLAGCKVIPKGVPTTAPPPEERPSDALPADQMRHRVALLVPMSGPNAEVGQSIANSTTMALLDTNAQNLRITTYDTAAGAGLAANKAILDGNRLILGPLLAVGVSLGGNALMRWAGEHGEAAREQADAIAAICSPLDLARSGHAIGKGFNRQVYTRMFLRSMKPKALAKLAQHPGLFARERLMAARDLFDFDNVFTAPLHGFRDTQDYWQRASAKPLLKRVRVPALLLNPLNDPFVPASSLPRPQDVSDSVTLWQPRHGGHVGFAAGRWPGHVRGLPDRVGQWLLHAAGVTLESAHG